MKQHRSIHLIALISAICLLIASFSGCAGDAGEMFVFPTRQLVGEETYTFGSYTYQIYDDDTVIIVNYSGSETNLVIPDTIEGKKVTAIGYAAFMDNASIQSVKLNKSLEMIDSYAFCACTSLTSVTGGDNVWRIDECAFEQTPWLAAQTDDFVVLGDGVLLLYQGKSNDVRVPDGIKHLSAAFATLTTVTSVELGDDVLTVGDYAFAFNTALRRVVLGKNVKSIGAYAFDGCTYLPHIALPDGVEVIGDYAFNDCNYLVDIRLGSSLREIGQYAFKYCSRLMCVQMPSTVERIAGYAFADCYSLSLVHYGGTEAQFEALNLDGSNAYLKGAHMIYESNGGVR